MNVTISERLERARDLARRRGISLQELIRDQLRLLAGERLGSDTAHELLELRHQHPRRSGRRREA